MITSLDGMDTFGYSSFYTSLTSRPNTQQVLQSLRKTIRSFQLKNKSIYKQYKGNLKQGLEKKIATYKIQSLMVRREEKEKMEQEKKDKEKYFEEMRRKNIKQKRLERLSSRIYVVETLEEKAEKVRQKAQVEKIENEKVINEREEKNHFEKVSRKIKMSKDRSEGKRKREDRSLIAEMKQRDWYANQMKKQLEDIIQKEEVLEELEEELRRLESGQGREIEVREIVGTEELKQRLEDSQSLW